MNDCDNQSRGNGVASPNTPRWPEADSEDDELEALQEEITRGAHPRELKRRMPVPGIIADEETKQPIDDNLHEPRTPVDNPPRKRKGRGTKWGTPSEKHLNDSRKCVVSRAYKAAVSEARKSGACEEDAARAGRAAYKATADSWSK